MNRNHLYRWPILVTVAALCVGQTCNFRIGDGPNGDGSSKLAFTQAPEDLAISCSQTGNAAGVTSWLASAKATTDHDCKPVTITNDFIGLSDHCDANGWVTTVTWTATDDCGAIATTSADLIISDPDPPVITLTGSPSVTIERLTGAYTEQGAVASIGCGTATMAATVGGDVVDVNTRDVYVVTYDAADACGNAATQVIRTVKVVDPPQFTNTPQNLSVTCDDSQEAADQLAQWLASATAVADELCGDATITHAVVGLADTCTPDGWNLKVAWTAADECGLSTIASATLTVLEPITPAITLNGSDHLTLECHQDTYTELGASVSLGCPGLEVPATIGGDTVDVNTPGTYVVTYVLADACGHTTATLTRTVEVVDTLPPEVTVKPLVELWPPNHKYETLHLSDCATATDLCEGDLDIDEAGTILSIYSDESDNATGDGNTTSDIVIVDHSTFKLRAERQGGGDGRVYGINFRVTDHAGNTTDSTCFAGVPHDQSGQTPVDGGPDHTVMP